MLKFTIEKEKNYKLNFLNLMLIKEKNCINTTWDTKKIV